MKLRDLDGRFVFAAHAGGYKTSTSDRIEGAQGVLFQCPKCAEGKEVGEKDGRRFVAGAHSILVFFINPIGAPVAGPECDHNPRWTATGDTIDTLTLSPSVNLNAPRDDGVEHGCRWHGHVRNGEAA